MVLNSNNYGNNQSRNAPIYKLLTLHELFHYSHEVQLVEDDETGSALDIHSYLYLYIYV